MLDFCVCIPTYKRPQLLTRLIGDLLEQSARPRAIIVVDGDPASGEVRAALNALELPDQLRLLYLPSNHANLPYQRYLGWLAAHKLGVEILLYLDDDLRLRSQESVRIILEPFSWQERVVAGVTALSISDDTKLQHIPALRNRRGKFPHQLAPVLRLFSPGKDVPPGGITAVGNRVHPSRHIDHPGYGRVEWLQGRVMAYNLKFLTQDCFLEDLFALAYINCGIGEDTVLSRLVASKGELWLAFDAQIEHPDEAPPNSYPIQAFRYGYACAYSRRLINDHIRGFAKPSRQDRIFLLISYIGNLYFQLAEAFRHPARYRFALMWGYLKGGLRGMFSQPTAERLSPGIDWWASADAVLSSLIEVR